MRGCLDRAQDVIEIARHVWVRVPDVRPRVRGQNDRATIRIGHFAHTTIVPCRFRVVDWLFEPSPILSAAQAASCSS
jgi:hypothetical protein